MSWTHAREHRLVRLCKDRHTAKTAKFELWRRIGLALLCTFALLGGGRRAAAHDLAIDQVMLWPDRSAGVLRGEITFDPELTRAKDAIPSEAHAAAVIGFLKANLQLSLDGQVQSLDFQVRELWVRGGATLGDLVLFSLPLPAAARELRLFASAAFKGLIVSVQVVTPARAVDTTSWLLARGEWTPIYELGAGWRQSGWRAGGPEAFPSSVESGGVESSSADRPSVPALHFVRLGFEHILPDGLDHMLFVAGLVLGGAPRYRRVLIALTLFTLAHTLTLALVSLQVFQVSPGLVEPLIALSIFVVGVDNLRPSQAGKTRSAARYLVVLCFGLVHGLGFANALSELPFDRNQLLLSLFSFNVGVELGQVAVVVLLGLMLHALSLHARAQRFATMVGSAAIALSGLFMVAERLLPARGELTTCLTDGRGNEV